MSSDITQHNSRRRKKWLFRYRIRATTTVKLATKHRMPSKQRKKRATGKVSLDSELFIGGQTKKVHQPETDAP
jgi:hypothetical protein